MEAAFQIINAAAGSGKTFTLVRQYLKQLLESSQLSDSESFLALTFTNKAVHEMKERLLEHLYQLTLKEPDDPSMREYLIEDTGFSNAQIQAKAQNILQYILHHYSRFDVITLDGFTHRIVRTFANDLELPPQFELILDSGTFLDEMIDEIIEDLGVDPSFTELLMEYSQMKMQEGHSGTFELNLKEIARVLIRENDLEPFQALMNLSQKQLEEDLLQLKKIRSESKNNLDQRANELWTVFQEKGIRAADCSWGEPFKSLQKIRAGAFKGFGKRVQNQLEGNLAILKPKNAEQLGINTADFDPWVLQRLESIQNHWIRNQLTNQMLFSGVPMLLLKQMEVRLQRKQEHQQQLLLARLNTVIAEVLAEQPTPYIYERLGVRYRHFFLDEFQDTSALQWQNLIPLIDNSLNSQETDQQKASVFLVGDPKQAIYRWRGGHVEQYLDLLAQETFGFTSIHKRNLQINYRSHSTIVDFNNALFRYASQQLKEPDFQSIYRETVVQQVSSKAVGYVQIDRYSKAHQKSQTEENILNWTLGVVNKLKAEQIPLGQVACLVRNNAQAQLLGEFLAAKGIKIQASESLILGKNPLAVLLMALLEWSLYPRQQEAQLTFIEQLWQLNHQQNSSYHSFVAPLICSTTVHEFFQRLQQHWQYDFHLLQFEQLPLYEALVYASEVFLEQHTNEVGLLFLWEDIHLFSQRYHATKQAYLNHWGLQAQKTYIPGQKAKDAVQIMTFHKAKGLQFSAVIIPFLDDKINHSKDRIWFPVPEEMGLNSSAYWMKLTTKIADFGPMGKFLWEQHERESQFDALNLIYVGCTRAKNVLFLNVPNLEGEAHQNTAHWINRFLDTCSSNQVEDNRWVWGELQREKSADQTESISEVFKVQLNHDWKKRLLVPRVQEQDSIEAIAYGVLIHDLMGKIFDTTDVTSSLEECVQNQELSLEESEILEQKIRGIVEHPQLASYFQPNAGNIFNERELLLPDGSIIRPDRLQQTSEGWVLIDYKTGVKRSEHLRQMHHYSSAVEAMGLPVAAKILVYCAENITLEWG
ncbi:MAG: UvrD-helicase domain-containing protein [Flavobacteriaceae bacterium]